MSKDVETKKVPPPNAQGRAFRAFDRGLSDFLEKQRSRIMTALEGVETRIDTVEDQIVTYVQGLKRNTDRDLDFANELVTKELRSKVLMSQWTNSFLSGSTTAAMDPFTYGFARFALHCCLC